MNKTTLKQRFHVFLATTNSHDLQAILGWLADDFELHFTEYNFSIDKSGMSDVLGWDKGVNGTITAHDLSVEGRRVCGTFIERNDFFDLLGIEGIEAKVTYEFDNDGLLRRQTYTPLPNQPSFQEEMRPAIEWARKNQPEELAAIYVNNQMQFNQAMGERWVALLGKWNSIKTGQA